MAHEEINEEATRAAVAVSETLDTQNIGVGAASIALVRILKLLHEQTGTDVDFAAWVTEIEARSTLKRGREVAQA